MMGSLLLPISSLSWSLHFLALFTLFCFPLMFLSLSSNLVGCLNQPLGNGDQGFVEFSLKMVQRESVSALGFCNFVFVFGNVADQVQMSIDILNFESTSLERWLGINLHAAPPQFHVFIYLFIYLFSWDDFLMYPKWQSSIKKFKLNLAIYQIRK
jgi:hypothetical protein